MHKTKFSDCESAFDFVNTVAFTASLMQKADHYLNSTPEPIQLVHYCHFKNNSHSMRVRVEMWDCVNVDVLLLARLREKIHYIRTEGPQGVEKLSCDADLVMLLRYRDCRGNLHDYHVSVEMQNHKTWLWTQSSCLVQITAQTKALWLLTYSHGPTRGLDQPSTVNTLLSYRYSLTLKPYSGQMWVK